MTFRSILKKGLPINYQPENRKIKSQMTVLPIWRVSRDRSFSFLAATSLTIRSVIAPWRQILTLLRADVFCVSYAREFCRMFAKKDERRCLSMNVNSSTELLISNWLSSSVPPTKSAALVVVVVVVLRRRLYQGPRAAFSEVRHHSSSSSRILKVLL